MMILNGGTLTMDIFNNRGNITQTTFLQIEPVPDINDPLTNLFPLISSGPNQYLNETLEIQLEQTSVDNFPDGTIFTVKAEVRND